MRLTTIAALTAALALTGCKEDNSEGFYVGQKTQECDLESFDSLADTSWAMLEALPDKTERAQAKARMHFFKEDGRLKVKYTVASLGNVYVYDCKVDGTGDSAELQCYEESRVRDWCQALEVWQEGSCTPEKLTEFGEFYISDEELAEEIADAKKWVDKYRDKPEWAQVKLNNNNLGNKLQGQLFIKLDKRKCRLRVSDMYMTIYDGNKVVDSNPVGTNPFVRLEGEWLWEHCGDGFHLVDFDEPSPEALEKPETIKPPHMRFHPCNSGEVDPYNMACAKPNATVHYHYVPSQETDLKKASIKAEEGCTYSYDSYVQWQPQAQNVQVSVEKDKVKWYASHHWDDLQGENVGVFTMDRYKTCDGKRERIDVVCNAAKFQ